MAKVVVITGASSGLGLSHAIYLTAKGYTVFGTCRDSTKITIAGLKDCYERDHTKWRFTNKDKTKVKAVRSLIPRKIKKELPSLLEKITFYSMDVTSEESVKKAIAEMTDAAREVNGRGIDVLINNAGIGFFGSAEKLSMKDWQLNFETNFFGQLRVVKAVLPAMKERKAGRIINTSSLGGLIAIPYQSHYSAAKSAIKVLSEGLNIELRQFGIKVSCILPSDINTNFNKNTTNLSNEEQAVSKSSVDLGAMIANNPVDKKSHYYQTAKKTWKVIIQNLIVSPPPVVVSRKVARIIKAKRPRVNYKVGDFGQKVLLFLIRRVLSDDVTYALLPKYYGM